VSLKHIVVGWHRGGFGYAAKFLASCGFNVGFTFDHTTTSKNLKQKLQQAKEVELSPWLVPFLNHEELQDIPITFMLRDPMMVFNSLVHHGHFQGNQPTALESFIYSNIRRFLADFGGKPLQAPVAYLTTWYNVAQTYVKNLKQIQVEQFPYSAIKHFNSSRQDVPFICPYTNATEYIPYILPSNLPDKVRKPMRELLTVTGYCHPNTAPPFGTQHYIRSDWNM
jgi:hypothetical protein